MPVKWAVRWGGGCNGADHEVELVWGGLVECDYAASQQPINDGHEERRLLLTMYEPPVYCCCS